MNDYQDRGRSYASLTILSRHRSANELMQLVPFPPDRSWQKGTPRYKNPVVTPKNDPRNVHRNSGATYKSHLDEALGPEGTAPEAHIADIIRRLSPAKESLRVFAEQARLEDPETMPLYIRLVVETTRGEIGFHFSAQLMKSILNLGSELGLEVEFDEEELDS